MKAPPAALTAALLLLASVARAQAFDYALKPRTIAPGVHVVEGQRQHFSRENGGNIVNTGFIETDSGVIVIDSGPSRRYGEQLRAAVRRDTGKDVIAVFISHAHPDHFLGNQAYTDVPIIALPATIAGIRNNGDALAANLYRLVGGWMTDTQPVVPTAVAVAGERRIDGRRLLLIALEGHTTGDLAILDIASGTLFAGDLAFLDRTATTPDADLARWLDALQRLDKIPFKQLVPGHGPVLPGAKAISQTRDYLMWLQGSLREAAANGKDIGEILMQPPPERFRALAVFHEEFARSLVHLYPAIESASLPSLPRER